MNTCDCGPVMKFTRTDRGMRPCPVCYRRRVADALPEIVRQGGEPPTPEVLWSLRDRAFYGDWEAFRASAYHSLVHWRYGTPLPVVVLSGAQLTAIQFGQLESFATLGEVIEAEGLLIIRMPERKGRGSADPDVARVLDERRTLGRATWMWTDLTEGDFARRYPESAAVLGIEAPPEADDPEPTAMDVSELSVRDLRRIASQPAVRRAMNDWERNAVASMTTDVLPPARADKLREIITKYAHLAEPVEPEISEPAVVRRSRRVANSQR